MTSWRNQINDWKNKQKLLSRGHYKKVRHESSTPPLLLPICNKFLFLCVWWWTFNVVPCSDLRTQCPRHCLMFIDSKDRGIGNFVITNKDIEFSNLLVCKNDPSCDSKELLKTQNYSQGIMPIVLHCSIMYNKKVKFGPNIVYHSNIKHAILDSLMLHSNTFNISQDWFKEKLAARLSIHIDISPYEITKKY